MYFNSVKVKDYKCFKENLEGFEKILPINIIIGKNNSGKSSLIDIIECICEGKNSIKNIFSEYNPTYQQFRLDYHNLYGENISDYGINTIYKNAVENKKIIYEYIARDKQFELTKQPQLITFNERYDSANLKSILEKKEFRFFAKYKFRRLNAERDISAESDDINISVSNNGIGVTNIFQQFLNRKDLQKQKLIKKDFLLSINSIVKPEIEFIEISVQKSNLDSKWEICFEDKFGNNIFLSQMGSGMKTIILVLVNLLLLPSLNETSTEDYVFAFEELENNLHPSLQRKIYQYIKDFAEKNGCLFFITTHSNIGIDIFYNSEISQLVSVNNTNGISTCKTIIQTDHLNELLSELGFKASDLLQTNGIIWVEGPSDRTYINRWISLVNDKLIEGVHYTIMFYGGKLLSHLSFNESNLSEFILLLKINKNAYVIIDKDAKKINEKLNSTKTRIQSEIGENSCWITKGREIENYIPESSIRSWLDNKKVSGYENFAFGLYDKLESILPSIAPTYNLNKSGYSKEIVNFITQNELNTLDLKEKIQDLVNKIIKWNL